jgi:polyisoprenoid-binding protein YceI
MSVVESVVPQGVWSADKTHSNVSFEVEHMGLSIFEARFTDFDAELVSAPDGLMLSGKVRTESVDVQDEVLRAHLLAPDFLDEERYRELAFESSVLESAGDDLAVEGNLTIRGTTRPVRATGRVSSAVADPMGNERMALVLETAIDRTDFGLDFQIAMPDGSPALGNEVKLSVSLELVKNP